MRWLNGLVLLFAATGGARAQNDPANPVFRSRSDLIQVNVVARDKHGKPVADLRREEFQVFDNEILQEIRVFDGQHDIAAAQPTEPDFSNIFSNHIAASGPQNGYTVIVIDDLFSGSDPANEEGSAFSRSRVLEMLKSVPAGEKIAIYAPGITFRVICEFTSDRDLLEKELRKWKPRPTTPAIEARPNMQSPIYPQAAQAQSRASEEEARIDGATRSAIGDAQFTAIADHLQGIPGRKKMLWLANKFPIGGRALQSLNRAGVALYPIDIDGVCRLCPERPKQAMDGIAAMTGGLAFHGRNDLSVAMREAMEDGTVSYTLGFYALTTEDDVAAPVHRLTVKSSRPGVELRYGTTYLPAPRVPASLAPGDLAKAMNRPVDASAISFSASIERMQDRLSMDAVLHVEDLDLTPDQDRWTGKIEFAARFTTADAAIAADALTQTIKLNLGPESYEAAGRTGLRYRSEIKIPPKAVELKLLFANPASGKIGTLTIPLSRVKTASGSARSN